VDCLQYFTSATGRVRSFNWLDTTSTTIRQLNNQNYNICFRTEIVAGQVRIIYFKTNPISLIFIFIQAATQICLSLCSVTHGDAFSITTPVSTAVSNAAAAVATATTNLAAAQAAQAAASAAFLAANGGSSATPAQIQALTDANNALKAAQAALAAAQAALAAASATATHLSAVGTSASMNGVNTATCLYDYLLIPGARDSTNLEADRYCGNALNPSITQVGTSVQVCSKLVL
jgi:hypothetical protein